MSQDTATRILKAALVEFSERGYPGASMRRMASIVGVQAPSIYAHFNSKQALLRALLEREGPVSGTTLLEEARLAASEPAQVLDRFTSRLIESWSSTDARRFRGLYDRLPADLMRQVSYLGAIEKLLDALTTLFHGWARGGRMRNDLPPRLLAWEFGAPIGNLRTSYWAWGQSPAVVRRGRRLARSHVGYFISCALKAQPGSPSRGRGGAR